MSERTPSNPNPNDPTEGFEHDRHETQQGFEHAKEDVNPESEENAEELYSGEMSGEIVDPAILHHPQTGSQGTGSGGNS